MNKLVYALVGTYMSDDSCWVGSVESKASVVEEWQKLKQEDKMFNIAR